MASLHSGTSSTRTSPSSAGEPQPKATPGTDLTADSPSASDAHMPGTPDAEELPPAFCLRSLSLNTGDTKVCQPSRQGSFDLFGELLPAISHPATASLSPTANSFKPLGPIGVTDASFDTSYKEASLCGSPLRSAPLRGLQSITAPRQLQDYTSPPRNGLLSLSSVDLRSYRSSSVQQQLTSDVSKANVELDWMALLRAGQVSRFLKISNVQRGTDIDCLNLSFTHGSFHVPQLVVLSELLSSGFVYAYFPDVRDACAAFAHIYAIHPEWALSFVEQERFTKALDLEQGFDANSELMITATCDGPQDMFTLKATVDIIRNFLISFGQYYDFEIMLAQFPSVVIKAEYFDADAAQRARDIREVKVAGVALRMRSPEPGYRLSQPWDGSQEPSCLKSSHYSRSPEKNGIDTEHWAEEISTGPRSGLFKLREPFTAPAEYQRQNNSLLGSGFATAPIQRRFGPRSERQTNQFASGHHNVVDISRISQGVDVRTTIMLRNIPNKITQAMLKDIIDETSRGKYDFMYLRIDFANNCNVGYAFINFEDPWDIIDFVKARAGRRWNCFNSDKIAEVSYATIQGKDCLVQKFRNSSVMMEHPSFRPKIFRTGTGVDAGQEEDFPGPDNTTKMRRSVENAEHVGLFAPRAGQHVRDEQRRRRSQFDRGTRYAQLECALQPENNSYPAGFAF